LAVRYRQKEGSFCAKHSGTKELDVKDIQTRCKTEVKQERNEILFLSYLIIKIQSDSVVYITKCC